MDDDSDDSKGEQKTPDNNLTMETSQQYKINKRPKDDITDDAKQDSNNINVILWCEWDPKWEYQLGSHCHASFSFALPNDIIIAYNYLDIDQEWFLWLLSINNLSPTQFIWNQLSTSYKTYLYTKDMANDQIFLRTISMSIQRKLQQHKNTTITIKPYFGSEEDTHIAIEKIKKFVGKPLNKNIKTCICTMDWANKWANKMCLHRYLDKPEKQSLFEVHNCYKIDGLTQNKGYICNNFGELLLAFDKLTQEIGHTNIVIKECFGDGGMEVFFYKTKQEIIDNFDWKKYFETCLIEENLNYNKEYEVKSVDFVGVQFYENEVVGCGKQIFHEKNSTEFIGSQKYMNKKAESKLKEIALNVMKCIGAEHVGGFDFAVQHFKNGDDDDDFKIYLIDMNTARYTEVTGTGVLQKKLGFEGEDKFWIMKNLMIKDENVSFKTIVNDYNDILFNLKDKNGVYFHSFHPKNKGVIVSIFGENEKHTYDLLDKLTKIDIFKPMEQHDYDV